MQPADLNLISADGSFSFQMFLAQKILVFLPIKANLKIHILESIYANNGNPLQALGCKLYNYIII